MPITAPRLRLLPLTSVAFILVALLGLTVIVHVLPSGPGSHLADYFKNSLHGPGFAFLTVTLLATLRLGGQGLNSYLYAGIAAMTIGVISEAAQIPGPRVASMSDLANDLLGTIAGLGTFAAFDIAVRARIANLWIVVLRALSAIAVVAVFAPALYFAFALDGQVRAMPTILTFDKAWERAAYSGARPNQPGRRAAPPGWPAGSGMVSEAQADGPSGLLIRIEPHSDWAGYRELQFVAAAPDGSDPVVRLVIREQPDESGNAGAIYSTSIKVGQQPADYAISLRDIQVNSDQPKFDLTRVSSISLFATGDSADAIVLLDNFRLQ